MPTFERTLLPPSSVLKMEATDSSKTLATAYQNVLQHIPVGHNLITEYWSKNLMEKRQLDDHHMDLKTAC
jgi:hypothetical protein